MTINIKGKHVAVLGIVVALGIAFYFFRGQVAELAVAPEQKVVNSALAYLNDQSSTEGLLAFSTDFAVKLLTKYKYYKVEQWTLTSQRETDSTHLVMVKGSAINAFGAKLDRNPTFVVLTKDGKSEIIDTYNLFVMEKVDKFIGRSLSDMQKHNLIEAVREKVKIEKWSFEDSYGGSVQGKATIYNGSDLPVSFVKLHIIYKDRSGNTVNTDDTYAVGSNELRPGQRRVFEWYTSNCYDCSRASIRLEFDWD